MDLKIFTFTWNLGNASPDGFDSFLLQHLDHDIIVIGVQESIYGTVKKSSDDWFQRVESILGNEFVTIGKSATRGSIMLIVSIRQKYHHLVHSIQSDACSSTVPLFWKKGANGICFNVLNRTLCFVNLHLSAHEGNLPLRIIETENILRKLDLGNVNFDISNQFHHTFILGDFNHRIIGIPYHESFPMDRIHEYDQLMLSQKRNKTLTYYKEGPITFPPTFKKIKGNYTQYKSNRKPSWCDRILSHSVDGFEKDLQLLSYADSDMLLTSDHAPVYASYKMDIFGTKMLESDSLMAYGLRFDNFNLTITNGRFRKLEDSMIKLIVLSPLLQAKYNESVPSHYQFIQDTNLLTQTIPIPADLNLINDFIINIAIYKCEGMHEMFSGLASFNLSEYIHDRDPMNFNTKIVWSGIGVGTISGTVSVYD